MKPLDTSIDRINGAFEGPHWSKRQGFDLQCTVEWLMLDRDERNLWGSLRNYKTNQLRRADFSFADELDKENQLEKSS